MQKRILAILLSLVLIAVFMTGCGKAEPMNADMTAFDYARDMGIGLNLGNTFDAYWSGGDNTCSGSNVVGEGKISDYETCWGAVVTTKEMIDGMRDEGFNTVRIPVYWGNDMSADSNFTISKALLKRVEEVVNYCLDDGLYAVVNIHHYDGYVIENFPKDEALDIVEKLWKQIADHFKNYGDHLVFEGFNESVGNHRKQDSFNEDEIYDFVNALNQNFVDAVRSTGGNNSERMLIVSGYNTNIDSTTNSKFKMPKDSAKDRLMVSVHYVDNWPFWANSVGSKWWYDYSVEQCELLKKAFTDNGIPVFMGECTAGYPKDRIAANAEISGSSADYVEMILRMELEYGFVPVIWDINSAESFYAREICKIRRDDNRNVIQTLLYDFFED